MIHDDSRNGKITESDSEEYKANLDIHLADSYQGGGNLTDRWLESLDMTTRQPLINSLRKSLASDEKIEVSEHKTLIAALKNKQDVEKLRLSLTAMETKMVWRSMQKYLNDLSFVICQKAKSEWKSISNDNDELMNSNLISDNLHYGKCYVEYSGSVEPSELSVESQLSIREGSTIASNISDCINFYDKWQRFRQLVLQTVL